MTTDFHPTDTDADPDEIRRRAERLQSISGVLLGHGDAVHSVLSQVALSFSEVVSPAVAAQIGNNAGALETAVEGTQYGYAVGRAWADDVDAFIAARNDLLYRWELAGIDDFGVPPTPNLWPLPEAAEAERLRLENRVAVADARKLALDSFVTEGHLLWEQFQDRVIEKARMFREGPTAENLVLVVSHLGWGAMTLWPEFAPPPVSATEGVTAGTTVIDGLDGAAGPQAVTQAIADVAAILSRAQAGQELTPAEIDFLAAFYETVGERITELPDYLAGSSFTYTTSAPTSRTEDDSPPSYSVHTVGGLDSSVVAALTAASANGMLVLSRSGPGGGGYARLPTWVRDALDGDEIETQPLSPTTSPPMIGVGSDIDQLGQLAELLDYSTVEAGTGLSHRLAMTTQDLIRLSADAGYFFLDDTVEILTADVDSMGRTFLHVVARNDEATYDLILGEDMPDSYAPETFFADVYGFEWSDDGESAGQLTDFIPSWATEGSPDQIARAETAMRAIVEIVASDAEFAAFMDGVGTSGVPEQSSLGQVNPEITQSLARSFGAFVVDFAAAEPSEGDQDTGTGVDTLDFLTRVRFTTLLGTDPVAGAGMAAAMYAYEDEQLAGYAADPGSASEVAAQTGRLRGIVEAGLTNAGMDITSNRHDAEERADTMLAEGLGALASTMPNPVAKGFAQLVASVISEAAAGGSSAGQPESILEAPQTTSEQTFAQTSAVAEAMLATGMLDQSALPPTLTISGEGTIVLAPGTPNDELDGLSAALAGVINPALALIDPTVTPPPDIAQLVLAIALQAAQIDEELAANDSVEYQENILLGG